MQFLFDEKNKKENILEKYISIIKKNNYKSNDVLMLVDNNIIKLDYIQRINLEMSEELKICTYSQFVKQELIKYWSIV